MALISFKVTAFTSNSQYIHQKNMRMIHKKGDNFPATALFGKKYFFPMNYQKEFD